MENDARIASSTCVITQDLVVGAYNTQVVIPFMSPNRKDVSYVCIAKRKVPGPLMEPRFVNDDDVAQVGATAVYPAVTIKTPSALIYHPYEPVLVPPADSHVILALIAKYRNAEVTLLVMLEPSEIIDTLNVLSVMVADVDSNIFPEHTIIQVVEPTNIPADRVMLFAPKLAVCVTVPEYPLAIVKSPRVTLTFQLQL